VSNIHEYVGISSDYMGTSTKIKSLSNISSNSLSSFLGWSNRLVLFNVAFVLGWGKKFSDAACNGQSEFGWYGVYELVVHILFPRVLLSMQFIPCWAG